MNFKITGARVLAAIGAGIVIGGIGVGIVFGQNPLPDQSGKEQLALSPTVSPEESARTEAEKLGMQEESFRFYRDWLDQFNASGADPKSLEWVPLMATGGDPPKTLDEAVESAELVVSGTVESVRFIPYNTVVTLRVESAPKFEGDSQPQTVVITFNGGPYFYGPDKDNLAPVMSYAEYAPLLLTGDKALLFLEKAENFSKDIYGTETLYYPQPYAGVNRVEGMTVKPIDGSSLSDSLNGLGLQEALARVSDAAK